jgi:hypothetical protein
VHLLSKRPVVSRNSLADSKFQKKEQERGETTNGKREIYPDLKRDTDKHTHPRTNIGPS